MAFKHIKNIGLFSNFNTDFYYFCQITKAP
jgi:hypothetical protein